MKSMLYTLLCWITYLFFPPSGNSNGKQNTVYFILKGQCQIIQHMELATHKINGHKYFRLLSKDFPLRPNEQLDVHFTQVCLMNKGECFNVGESQITIFVHSKLNELVLGFILTICYITLNYRPGGQKIRL
jgi:hypothetical protein